MASEIQLFDCPELHIPLFPGQGVSDLGIASPACQSQLLEGESPAGVEPTTSQTSLLPPIELSLDPISKYDDTQGQQCRVLEGEDIRGGPIATIATSQDESQSEPISNSNSLDQATTDQDEVQFILAVTKPRRNKRRRSTETSLLGYQSCRADIITGPNAPNCYMNNLSNISTDWNNKIPMPSYFLSASDDVLDNSLPSYVKSMSSLLRNDEPSPATGKAMFPVPILPIRNSCEPPPTPTTQDSKFATDNFLVTPSIDNSTKVAYDQMTLTRNVEQGNMSTLVPTFSILSANNTSINSNLQGASSQHPNLSQTTLSSSGQASLPFFQPFSRPFSTTQPTCACPNCRLTVLSRNNCQPSLARTISNARDSQFIQPSPPSKDSSIPLSADESVRRRPSLYTVPQWQPISANATNHLQPKHAISTNNLQQDRCFRMSGFQQGISLPEASLETGKQTNGILTSYVPSRGASSQTGQLRDRRETAAGSIVSHPKASQSAYPQNMIVDIAQTCQATFPFALIAERHNQPIEKVFDVFSAVIQIPFLQCAVNARRCGKLGSTRMKEFREAKKIVREQHKSEKKGSREKRKAESKTLEQKRLERVAKRDKNMR